MPPTTTSNRASARTPAGTAITPASQAVASGGPAVRRGPEALLAEGEQPRRQRSDEDQVGDQPDAVIERSGDAEDDGDHGRGRTDQRHDADRAAAADRPPAFEAEPADGDVRFSQGCP